MTRGASVKVLVAAFVALGVLFASAVVAALVLRSVRSAPDPGSRRVTIPEGFTSFQIAKRLSDAGVCAEGAFIAATRSPELLAELSIAGPSAEGYLFPATYELGVSTAPEDVVRQLVRESRRRLHPLFERHAEGFERLRDGLGWGEAEVLTLASIVEKEAAVEDERPIIASVYLNRLTDPDFRPLQRLQADPTAGYGCLVERGRAPSCAAYDGRIVPEMLRDALNRYNTYRHPGLPPGPIANPGEASVVAVLDHAETDYLYFVASGNGRHKFSRTFAEHNAAIRR